MPPWGLQYLRARWYDVEVGRFLTEDVLQGTVFHPISQHAYVYAADNPILYTDPTGHIAQKEASAAEGIVQQIKRYYNLEIKKDWEWRILPVPAPAPNIPVGTCSWDSGRWTMAELKLVSFAVTKLATAMGGETAFRNFMGPWRITKTPRACGRGCTRDYVRRIDLIDQGKPPAPQTQPSAWIIEPWSINFDAWTVVHELGHAWDANHDWNLSKGLEQHTGGFTLGHLGKALMPGWLWDACDADSKKPGCNKAGYFYGGIPPKGSDANFNRKEDFAESVAAYVFPDEAQQEVQRYRESELYGAYCIMRTTTIPFAGSMSMV